MPWPSRLTARSGKATFSHHRGRQWRMLSLWTIAPSIVEWSPGEILQAPTTFALSFTTFRARKSATLEITVAREDRAAFQGCKMYTLTQVRYPTPYSEQNILVDIYFKVLQHLTLIYCTLPPHNQWQLQLGHLTFTPQKAWVRWTLQFGWMPARLWYAFNK